MTPPSPPPLPKPGVQGFTLARLVKWVWWSLRSATINFRTLILVLVTLGPAAMLAKATGNIWWLLIPALIVPAVIVGQLATLAWWKWHDGWLIGYFTDDAALLLRPGPSSWVLTDHVARHLGAGLGAPLSRMVLEHLTAQAATYNVTISTCTRIPQLAAAWQPALPQVTIRRDRLGETEWTLTYNPTRKVAHHE